LRAHITQHWQLCLRTAYVLFAVACATSSRSPAPLATPEAPVVPDSLTDRAASLTGIVVDSAGQPIEAAFVSLLSPESPDSLGALGLAKTSVDARGSFMLTGIRPATYLFRVQRIGYHTLFRTITLSPGVTATQIVQLTPLPPHPGVMIHPDPPPD
jgi:hypothetical protein